MLLAWRRRRAEFFHDKSAGQQWGRCCYNLTTFHIFQNALLWCGWLHQENLHTNIVQLLLWTTLFIATEENKGHTWEKPPKWSHGGYCNVNQCKDLEVGKKCTHPKSYTISVKWMLAQGRSWLMHFFICPEKKQIVLSRTVDIWAHTNNLIERAHTEKGKQTKSRHAHVCRAIENVYTCTDVFI